MVLLPLLVGVGEFRNSKSESSETKDLLVDVEVLVGEDGVVTFVWVVVGLADAGVLMKSEEVDALPTSAWATAAPL